MNRHVHRAALAAISLCCLLAASCASGHREPYSGSEPAVRDLAAFEADLRAAIGGTPGASLVQAGATAPGGSGAPIWLVRIERPGATRRALVCAGIHGNEPARPSPWRRSARCAQHPARSPTPPSTSSPC